jgi:hypothetical protein
VRFRAGLGGNGEVNISSHRNSNTRTVRSIGSSCTDIALLNRATIIGYYFVCFPFLLPVSVLLKTCITIVNYVICGTRGIWRGSAAARLLGLPV